MQSMWTALSDRDYYGSGQDPEPEPDPRCPVCGNEEIHPRTGMLTCECPSPDTLEHRRKIAREMMEEIKKTDAA